MSSLSYYNPSPSPPSTPPPPPVPRTVVYDGTVTFEDDLSVVSFTVAEGVTEIKEKAFFGCKNLASLLPLKESKVTILGPAAFEGCVLVTSLEGIPEGVTEFGSGLFRNCVGINNIRDMPTTLVTIGKACFQFCTAIRSLEGVPPTIKKIQDFAFTCCYNLQNLNHWPANVPRISNCCFHICTSRKWSGVVEWGSGVGP